jgi:RNA-binding protein
MLTTKQRSALRSKANTLKPLVTIGKEELSESVISEIADVLFSHELVKVAALKSCTTSARQMCDEVCQRLDADAVQCVGNRFVVYKFSDKKDIKHIEV